MLSIKTMPSIKTTAVVASLSLALLAGPARSEDVKAGDLVISQGWSRATPAGAKIGGGYLTIENKGTVPDRLIGVSGDAAGQIEIHQMSMDKGVMKMRALDNGLPIDAGKTVKLMPNGYHLMMLDLKSPLKQGDRIPLTLAFEKAGTAKIVLDVQGIGAQAPASDHSGDPMEMKTPDHSEMKK